MNVFITGAGGKIGRLLVEILKATGKHTPVAMVRSREQAERYEAAGVRSVIANLESSVDELAAAIQGSDAIVFTAGSGGHTGYDKTILIDLDGAVKMFEAAELAGIKRFVMVSAFGAHRRELWSEAIQPYYAAKHYADRLLASSGLDYTILRPGRLLDEPGTGMISIDEGMERGSIPREDVAGVIAAVLEAPATIRRSYDLLSGKQSIGDAIAAI
ncbi:SDR family oxidoreductase [Paenibacillus sp. 1P07SE]|uniref:SDR family oxidoreductase n=1 Tax=Paenibacillus sp. 1P07SE TaxID=3132209 RepID=UPI0039A74519